MDLNSERSRVPQGDHTPATIFLDRDGVLNKKREGDYVRNWTGFEFLPKAKQALARLTRSGYRTIVVTNQRGIARGFMHRS